MTAFSAWDDRAYREMTAFSAWDDRAYRETTAFSTQTRLAGGDSEGIEDIALKNQ